MKAFLKQANSATWHKYRSPCLPATIPICIISVRVSRLSQRSWQRVKASHDVTPCRSVYSYQRLGRVFCIHLHGLRILTGKSKFLRNIGIYIPNLTASNIRRLEQSGLQILNRPRPTSSKSCYTTSAGSVLLNSVTFAQINYLRNAIKHIKLLYDLYERLWVNFCHLVLCFKANTELALHFQLTPRTGLTNDLFSATHRFIILLLSSRIMLQNFELKPKATPEFWYVPRDLHIVWQMKGS